MQRSAIRVISFGFGKTTISDLVSQGFEHEFCMTISGNAAYLSSSSVSTKLLLEPPDNPAEKYCYHQDDPAWGDRMILRHSEFISQWCSGASMIIIVVSASSVGSAMVGAAIKAARLLRRQARTIVSIVEKPYLYPSIVPLEGIDTLISESDTTLLLSIDRFGRRLPSDVLFSIHFERFSEMISSIIREIIGCADIGDSNNIPSTVFSGNGIAYAGSGEAASVKEAMDLALTSPMLEYSTLDRAGVVLAYIRIRQTEDMNDWDEMLVHLRNSFSHDIKLFTGKRIDPEHECRVIIIATNLS